jgi:hypothetical protein
MDLATQRWMHPPSRPESALEVKSSTQAVKQLSTRLPKSLTGVQQSVRGGEGEEVAYAHELLDLALLEALLEFSLFGGSEAVRG